MPLYESTRNRGQHGQERITIDGEGSIIEVERGKTYRIRHRLPPAVPGGKRKWSKMRTVHGNKAKARIELRPTARSWRTCSTTGTPR